MRFLKILMWLKRKENIMILIGLFIASCAICVPFIIIHYTKASYTLESFSNLGTIGDYFGGTTVGLLSLASIIFVTAAIIMQKEELQLQRIEVEKTRKEYEITNATMRKQQFDSTFFNMINLHHTILKEISLQGDTGRDAIALLLVDLKKEYDTKVLSDYQKGLKDELSLLSPATRKDLLMKSSIYNGKNTFIEGLKEDFFFDEDDSGFSSIKTKQRRIFDIMRDKDVEWLKEKEGIISEFNEDIEDEELTSEMIEKIDFEGLVNSKVVHPIINVYEYNYRVNPLKTLKTQAYEAVYNSSENKIGHYYRNLYRIIRLIQDEEFDVSEEKNEKEKKKYRGILRAQLSSNELMMIFYNVTYSRKGEKFRTYLTNTNFFDDHLIQSEFLWANDKDELKLI